MISGETSGRGKVQLHIWQGIRFHVRDGVLRCRVPIRSGTERDFGQGRQPV